MIYFTTNQLFILSFLHNKISKNLTKNHLSPDYPLRLLIPYPTEKMNAYPVSEMVNMAGDNDPTMLNPNGEKMIKEINQVPLNQLS